MLLNAFDVDTDSGECCVELRVGDFPRMGIDADLLVASEFEGHYAPTPGTLLANLQEAYGLRTELLTPAIDLREGPLKSWVSGPIDLEGDPSWTVKDEAISRFRRVAMVDGGMEFNPDDLLPWPPFNRLFSVLALLPMRGVHCRVVATPLLGSDNQDIEAVAKFPDLLNAYRKALNHVPELDRLIVFGRCEADLRLLGEAIDNNLERRQGQSARITIPQGSAPDALGGIMRRISRELQGRGEDLSSDMNDLIELLDSEEIPPIALGIHCRRVLEQLVRQQLSTNRDQHIRRRPLRLIEGIRLLQREGVTDWTISCMHQVRVFGNWMCHPQVGGREQMADTSDVISMVNSFERVLREYPWMRINSREN